MKVAMILADFAEAVRGKLYVMGGGWSITGPDPAPSAIALKIEIPWSTASRKHTLKLELLDGESKPVIVKTEDGEQPVLFGGAFEVEKGPEIPDTPLDVPFAINIPPLPLPPGRRYIWKLTVDGETREDWQLSFSTRPAAKSVNVPAKLTA